MKKYVATSLVVVLVAALSLAAGVWYADRDDDAMQYAGKGEDGAEGSWITVSESESPVSWTVTADGTKYVSLRPAPQSTKYINLNPTVQEDSVSSPSRRPDAAPDCDGIDCQQNG